MLAKLILVMTLLVQLSAQAEGVVIVPLLNTSNWIAGLNIPFRVTGISLLSATPVLTEVVAGTIGVSDCKVMRDPFIPENFLLRCLKSGTVSLKLTINPATTENPYAQTTVLKYGPLTIQKLDGLKIPDKSEGTDPDVIAGQQLFAAHCVECHTKSSKAGRTGEAIWNAIQNVGSMRKASLLSLTRSQLDQVSIYMETP